MDQLAHGALVLAKACERLDHAVSSRESAAGVRWHADTRRQLGLAGHEPKELLAAGRRFDGGELSGLEQGDMLWERVPRRSRHSVKE